MKLPVSNRSCVPSRATVLTVALAVAAACAHAQTASVPARADTVALRRVLDSLASAHRGVVGYSVVDVEDGSRFSLRGDETFPTASLIKVAVLVTLYDLVAKGEMSLDDPLVVLRADKVPGSGILQHLHDRLAITVADAVFLMMSISDNTATNLLLDRVIIRRVWDKMEALGLPHTKIHSKSFRRNTSVAMDSSVKYGLGVTTPNEMARLLELMATGRAVNPAADSAMLRVMENNTYRQMLQRHLVGVRSAFKDGEGDEIRTECALFYLRRRVVACVLTKQNQDRRWVIDNEAQAMMAQMGAAIISAYGGRTVFSPPEATPAR